VSPEVPVARAVLFDGGGLDSLQFPVIVKPNDEGSSKGIGRNAICYDAADADRRCRELQAGYSCPALVEEYLPGAEVTVGMAGNRHPDVLGMMEIAPRSGCSDPFVYSVDVKRDWRNVVEYHVPPRLPEQTREVLMEYAVTAYRLLGCRDIARMDFRLDAAGEPRFLECNALPGLNPENSDIVLMSRSVLPYDQLIRTILSNAADRYGLSLP
jgi:D-alanine-D-alanine ligase